MKNRTKPTVEEILAEFERCKKYYGELQEAYEEDERFYELEFEDDLNIPNEFAKDRMVLPTARDKVDSIVDHTDISNARVKCNKKGEGEIPKESAEMLRRFGLGLIHRTNVESSISPQRTSAKHYWLHGVTFIKTVWDADNWLDKPAQKEDESEESYKKRYDEWQQHSRTYLPISIKALPPATVYPDPHTGGKLYYIEASKRIVLDAMNIWKNWKNPKGRDLFAEVEYLEYWDDTYRCVLIDQEPVWNISKGVIKHKYGFIPYTMIESGLGNHSTDAKPEKRYVGIIRHMKDLLISQSAVFSMCNILTKMETMKGGYIKGADAESVSEVKQAYGKYWHVGDKDVEFVDWEHNLAPDKAYQHLAYITELIDLHSSPKSMFGVGETGVRSGADRRLVLAEAQSKLNYSKDAFGNGWAQVLTKCAKLVKYVIPDDFEIWTRTDADDFTVKVRKSLFKEPFNFYVEFSPISEQDEYRRHEDLLRMLNGGLYTKRHARSLLPDVDPEILEKQEIKEVMMMSPAFQMMLSQHLIPLIHNELTKAGLPMAMAEGQPQEQQQGMGAQGRGEQGVPNRAQAGSAQEMMNNMMAQYGRPNAGSGQGMGGGGNSLYGV